MLGKKKCRILKEIRQRIADENEIPYVTRECTYQGECAGTCPRCESELRYLERELAARQALGKTVTVAALCAVTAIGAAGCTAQKESGGMLAAVPPDGGTETVAELEGNVALPDVDVMVEGELAAPPEDGADPLAGEEVLPEDVELGGEPTADPADLPELTGDFPAPADDAACGPEAPEALHG